MVKSWSVKHEKHDTILTGGERVNSEKSERLLTFASKPVIIPAHAFLIITQYQ